MELVLPDEETLELIEPVKLGNDETECVPLLLKLADRVVLPDPEAELDDVRLLLVVGVLETDDVGDDDPDKDAVEDNDAVGVAVPDDDAP